MGGELPNNARSGLERFGASMAEMVSEKFVCLENAVAIHDLSGTERQDFEISRQRGGAGVCPSSCFERRRLPEPGSDRNNRPQGIDGKTTPCSNGDDPMPQNAKVLFEAAIPWSKLRAEV